jgi:hypothetical protein
MPVSATACAEIDADASVCVIAHHGSGTGMTVSTAAAITAGSCATGSNAPVAAPCSAITTKAANYDFSTKPIRPASIQSRAESA